MGELASMTVFTRSGHAVGVSSEGRHLSRPLTTTRRPLLDRGHKLDTRSMRRLAQVTALCAFAVFQSSCGLLEPAVDCRGVPEELCESAVERARRDAIDEGVALPPFGYHVVVNGEGCPVSGSCSPLIRYSELSVEFHSSGGELLFRALIET